MNYKTHVLSGLLVGGIFLLKEADPQIYLLPASAVGALIPDIDEPQSYAGRKIKVVSKMIKSVFGHRGITHSFLGMGIISLLIYFLLDYFNLSFKILTMFNLGYLSHLLTDLITKAGVPLLYPYKKKIRIPLIRTGGKLEFVFRTIVSAALLFIAIEYLDITHFTGL
ncbi:metal-dependent hydrolase [Halanaerobium praevalens]|uniref:Membrane-bound metal-dependent hydrolase n=1 Tax=Halanaerobium praevalens (strain ATCC 33744 / DSM 2228 / GSL) TaxID=572479 RepID=E3DR59_HALPG|nr:metal-dependent hydrolase [Halanaerobium praevalens]ADO76965.1 membrane-bound metal-dependent hydrolase [Halanaerobium praevalens DSM 2228]